MDEDDAGRHRLRHATLGAFIVGGVVLVLLGLLIGSGSRWWTRQQPVTMYFQGSIYGLQVGSPVVFRGVRLGQVTSVGMRYDPAADSFTIPVHAEVDPRLIEGLRQRDGDDTLQLLLHKGMTAQLATQSLLTGQLYVDLDLRPGKARALRGADAGTLEIPTSATVIQTLQAQIEQIDWKSLVDGLGGLIKQGRSLTEGGALQQTLKDAAATAQRLRLLSASLNQTVPPLLRQGTAALGDARNAARQVAAGASAVGAGAGEIGRTARDVQALVRPDAPLVQQLQSATVALTSAAHELQALAAEGRDLPGRGAQTLDSLQRAADAVQSLGRTLERQPDALLRGQATEGPWPPPIRPDTPP